MVIISVAKFATCGVITVNTTYDTHKMILNL